MKTLRQVNIGENVKVIKLHGEGAVKRRIMDMGITPSPPSGPPNSTNFSRRKCADPLPPCPERANIFT